MIDSLLSLFCMLAGVARVQDGTSTSFELAWRWSGDLIGGVLVIPDADGEQDLVVVPEIVRSAGDPFCDIHLRAFALSDGEPVEEQPAPIRVEEPKPEKEESSRTAVEHIELRRIEDADDVADFLLIARTAWPISRPMTARCWLVSGRSREVVRTIASPEEGYACPATAIAVGRSKGSNLIAVGRPELAEFRGGVTFHHPVSGAIVVYSTRGATSWSRGELPNPPSTAPTLRPLLLVARSSTKPRRRASPNCAQ